MSDRRALLAAALVAAVLLAGCTGGTGPASRSSAPEFPIQDTEAAERYCDWFLLRSQEILREEGLGQAADEWEPSLGGSHVWCLIEMERQQRARDEYFLDNPDGTEAGFEEQWGLLCRDGYDPYAVSTYGFLVVTFTGSGGPVIEEAIVTWDLETGEHALAVAD